jgi:dihydroxyacid dehydratase/phosphogluconate dehydratase
MAQNLARCPDLKAGQDVVLSCAAGFINRALMLSLLLLICCLSDTPAGQTMAQNLAGCPDLKAGQDVVLPVESPIKSTGHLQILYGNLCPDGSVAKITGKEGLQFTGQVRTAQVQ